MQSSGSLHADESHENDIAQRSPHGTYTSRIFLSACQRKHLRTCAFADTQIRYMRLASKRNDSLSATAQHTHLRTAGLPPVNAINIQNGLRTRETHVGHDNHVSVTCTAPQRQLRRYRGDIFIISPGKQRAAEDCYQQKQFMTSTFSAYHRNFAGKTLSVQPLILALSAARLTDMGSPSVAKTALAPRRINYNYTYFLK
jgi:hypothetical protein